MDDTGEEQTINVQENEVHSMPWSAKNGEVSHMAYASFGHGDHVLVILPGLSDGLTTVKGKALLLAGLSKLPAPLHLGLKAHLDGMGT